MKCVHTVWVPVIALAAVGIVTPGSARADVCAAAEREMAFGEAAAEDAKDTAGFKKAAEQFFGATQKAPKCAAAFFNLGIVQEKAGAYSAAKSALEKYLALAPKAPDAAEVRKTIFKLEYRLKKVETPRLPTPKDMEGYWRAEGRKGEPISAAAVGNWLEFDSFSNFLDWGGSGKQIGKKIKFRLDGYTLTGGVGQVMSASKLPGFNPNFQLNCLKEFMRRNDQTNMYMESTWRPVHISGVVSQDFKKIVFRYTDLALSTTECRYLRKEFTTTFYR